MFSLVILTLSKSNRKAMNRNLSNQTISQGKSIDKSIMYYSNKMFSGVLRGAGGKHV